MVFQDSEVGVASQVDLFGGANDEICDYNTICGGIERDLRQAGYETVWLVIPACSVGAPHRRDRVWIVANRTGKGLEGSLWHSCHRLGDRLASQDSDASIASDDGCHRNDKGSDVEGRVPTNQEQSGDRRTGGVKGCGGDVSDAQGVGLQRSIEPNSEQGQESGNELTDGLCRAIPNWQENWYEVATRFCRVDDGLPRKLDSHRLKALGNAIVPQVAYEIIKSIVELTV